MILQENGLNSSGISDIVEIISDFGLEQIIKVAFTLLYVGVESCGSESPSGRKLDVSCVINQVPCTSLSLQ